MKALEMLELVNQEDNEDQGEADWWKE
jgi:hypothetical protein